LLTRYTLEIVAVVWLVLVAVQYLSRYFITGPDMDFTWAYYGMLSLMIITVIGRLFAARRR